MKKYVIVICLITLLRVSAQQGSPTFTPNSKAGLQSGDVIKLDPRASAFDFVPGQILAKFKDETVIRLGKSANGAITVGIESVDEILSANKLKKAEKLFPEEKRILNKRLLKTHNGNEIEESSLHNIYKLEFDSIKNVMQIIDELKQNSNVIYAEPNYIMSIVESKPVSPELTEQEMLEWVKDHNLNPSSNLAHALDLPRRQAGLNLDLSNSSNNTVPNDPLYSQQSYISEVQADSVWKQTTGDTTQVIAILDTGVDWLHPDLKNKIWINKNEIPNNGIDDDGNGLIDDIRGWDWINNDNNPMDDNSHGTHVAGIAAAESNNNIGIAGVNWKAKIMPLKVFQSSGRGDAATITQAIIYAKNKNATVINMSFGSYTRSLTMEAALANAYATCVLVAAAGNDKLGIGPPTLFRPFDKPFFPAAISFVLGVEAPPLSPDGFTNFDQDGPVYSKYTDLLNYEMKAPGTNIISTVPNGGYRVYNGTSMSVPIISGGAALYKKAHPAHSQELMWGNLINSISGFVKLNTAIKSLTQPKLWVISNTIVDTLDGDKDGQVDAGETIELWFMLRNSWGNADKVKMKLRFGEFEDHSVATILRDTATVGSISSYARRSNEKNPFRIKINPSIAHNRDISLQVLCWSDGIQDTVYQKIVLAVSNGTELSGILDSTLVLTSAKQWLVNKSFRIGEKGKLLIKPGTNIIIGSGKFIENRGIIEAIGTKDSMIIFKSYYGDGKGISGNGGNFKYCSFSNLTPPIVGGNVNYCIIENVNPKNDWVFTGGSLTNSIIANNYYYYFIQTGSTLKKNNFIKNYAYAPWGPQPIMLASTNIVYNNFIDTRFLNHYIFNGPFFVESENLNIIKNSFINPQDYTIVSSYGNKDIINLIDQYWGSTNTKKISNSIYDFWKNASLPLIKYQPFLTAPSDSANGIVWKVLVNGKDAQDEIVDPLGVATHRFDVYFNRPMDKNYPPQITFGVREPYTQQSVALNGSWSADGKIYTAYKKVELYTGDGINRVRVAGARDLEDFEIPVEDMRFEFLIDAAGSASTDFLASAGIGKVKLEWPTPNDLPTLLGYNMYRFTNQTDTTFTTPIQINNQLVTDSTYTDFNVEPHKKYYYKYKVLRTDFTESDFSKVVNATVLTAAKGDANGDLAITVQDIVSIVAYILKQNPTPFLIEAADVNGDAKVDILDIVSVINKIMNPGSGKMITLKPKVKFGKESVYFSSAEGIAGIELKIVGDNFDKMQLITGELAKGMELAYKIDKDTLTALLFNFNNQTISGTDGVLLKLNNSTIKQLKEIKVSNAKGNAVEVEYSNDDVVLPSQFELYQNYPNPFNPTTKIKYGLPEKRDVDISIYNVLGQRIKKWVIKDQNAGYHEVIWNSRNDYNQVVSSGVYIYQIKAGNYIKQMKMLLLK
ncbi:MAG: Fervidolysin [Ignavibacteria bacterium]|nr:MAG: Fervidolysin [Ignavibacteria bacterium]KAF0160951.1 MAG: Fervidolysin [Ignavibacteria bacterium]